MIYFLLTFVFNKNKNIKKNKRLAAAMYVTLKT